MDSLVIARVKTFLAKVLRRKQDEFGAILFNMRAAAQSCGHDLDGDFGGKGLAVGPDARVASSIVDRALGRGGGDPVTDSIMNKTIDKWVRVTGPMGPGQ